MASSYSSKDSTTSATTTEEEDQQKLTTPSARSEDGEQRQADEDEDDDDSVVGGVNPTRDALQEGLLGLIRPTVDALDQRVCETVSAQEELRQHIEALTKDLEGIQERKSREDLDLEVAINKLNNAKKRVVVVANILQGAQDRLNRVHQNCLKETSKRRTLLEPSPASNERK